MSLTPGLVSDNGWERNACIRLFKAAHLCVYCTEKYTTSLGLQSTVSFSQDIVPCSVVSVCGVILVILTGLNSPLSHYFMT